MSTPLNRQALRRSGAVTVATLKHLAASVKPGVTTAELDAEAESCIRDHEGTPAFLGHHGFPSTICTSVNHQVVHGLPGGYVLQEGDVLAIDMGVKIEGWFTDAAITVGVGQVSDEAQALLDVTADSLTLALKHARAGKTTGDLGAAVQAFVEGHKMGVIRDCVGHGIGQKLHQEPSIPNYGTAGQGARFTKDMAVAIEPMVVLGSPEIKVSDDKWTVETRDRSLAAHFEETVIITDGEPERVTPLDEALSDARSGAKVGRVT